MEISVATSNNQSADRMTSFNPLRVPNLNSLGFVITMRAWSPCVWNNGYRLKKNFMHADLCALDFDTGEFTVDRAIALLKSDKLAGIVGVTKSHQVCKKTEPACDRFRLILPWDGRISDLATYEQNMARLMECFPADNACKDGARYFWPCAQIVYQQDGDLFAWTPYKAPEPRRPSQASGWDKDLKRVPPWMQVELARHIREGERNKTAFRFAIHLKRTGHNERETFDLLSPSITLDARELQTTIRSAFRYK